MDGLMKKFIHWVLANKPKQPKQSRVHVRRPLLRDEFSLLQKPLRVSVELRSDAGRLFHNLGAQAAELHGT